MEKTTLSDIRKELVHCSREELVAIALRMARFKKENKEHLAYLLFEKDEPEYIRGINTEISAALHDLKRMNSLQVKKTLQKTLRTITKNKKFCLSKIYEMEVMLHFTELMQVKKIPHSSSTYISQFYFKQVLKLPKILAGLDPDLQTDYQTAVDDLTEKIL